jgi:hypothetical protein
VGEGSVGGVDQALEVEVDHPVPLLGGRVLDRAQQHLAGVVDEDVEPPQLLDGAVDRGNGLLLVGDVGLDRQGGVALAANLCREALQPLEPAGRHRDFGPLFRQRARGRLADPAAGASDQRNRSVEWRRHRILSS